MTRAEMRARVLAGLNDASGILFPAATVHRSLDDAAEVLAEQAPVIKRTALIALEAGTIYYSLRRVSDDVIRPYRIVSRGTSTAPDWPMERLSLIELDQRDETWVLAQGDPIWWAPVSWDSFAICPHPAQSGGVLAIDYLAWPQSMQEDDDEPELPEGDHEALVLYGVYEGQAQRWAVQPMLEVWSLFKRHADAATGRSGQGRVQSRLTQRSLADTGDPIPPP